MATNKYEHLRTGTHEYIKQYITLDGSSRVEYVYEARANALHGESCMRTQYVYSGSSTTVVKMKETETTWDSTYDI